jgi:DNA protecting protein DprA
MAKQNEDDLRDLFERAKLKNAKSLAQTIAAERMTAELQATVLSENLAEYGVRIVHHFEPDFPGARLTIANPPGWLFVQGHLEILRRPLIAVVGTRSPSATGRFITECVCRLLADTDVVTVSGLADGVDAKVHELSLVLKMPTVAVLGTGILRDYPAHSRPMRDAIVERGGCVITEYLPEDGPAKENFVWRNRLQAGLAHIVIPSEWQSKSGTAHTVNFALNAKKPVLAVDADRKPPETSLFLMQHGNLRFRLPQQSPEFLEHVIDYLSRSYG